MFVSRWLALIFAVGLGWALFTGAGTAMADPSDSGSSTSSESSDGASGNDADSAGAGSSDASTPSESSESSDIASTPADATATAATDDVAGSSNDEDQPAGGESGTEDSEFAIDDVQETDPVATSTGEFSDGAQPGPESSVGSDRAVTIDAEASEPRASGRSATANQAPSADVATTETPTTATESVTELVAEPQYGAQPHTQVGGPAAPRSEMTTTERTVGELAPPTQSEVALLPAKPAPLVQICSALGSAVDGVLGVIQSLAALPGPTGSGEPPITWLVAAYVRREVGAFFFNSNPTASPVQIVQSREGVITGAVGADDVDGDGLTYQLTTAPVHGTVVVGADGWYTYTPSAALLATGGSDTFTVNVRDDGFRLPLVGTSGSVDVPVTVTVAAPGGPTIDLGDRPIRMVLNPDGTRAYMVGADQTVLVIDTEAGSLTANTVVDTIYVGSAIFVTVEDENGTSTEAIVQDSDELAAITTSPDGKRLYVVNATRGTVKVVDIDLTSAGLHSVLDTVGVGTGPTAIAVSPDAAHAYVANGEDGTVWVIDTSSGERVSTVAVGQRPSAMAVSPDGETLYVTNFLDNSVSVIDTATAAVAKTLVVGGLPVDVAVSADGSRVYTANSQSNSVSVIDTVTGEVINILVGGSPSSVAPSPDGAYLYVTESYADRVAVVDLAARMVITRVAVGDGPEDVALSPDGAYAYVANLYDGTVSQIALAPLPLATVTSTPPLGSTKGFHIYNVTGQELTLSFKKGNFENGGPPIGAKVAPGTYMDLEVVQYFFDDNIAIENWKTADGLTTFRADTWVYGFLTGTHTDCNASGGGRQCEKNAGRLEVYFLDAPGTVIKFDGPDGQQQAQVLNELCYEGSLAKCDFESSSAEVYYNNPVPAPGSLINDTSVEQIRGPITVSRKVTNTISWKLTFKAETGELVKRLVNFSFQTEFGHQWSEERTFTDVTTVRVPAFTEVRVFSADPVDRVNGRFVLKMYNTTWDLTNVYFDSANKTENAVLTYKEIPIVHGAAAA